MENEKTKSQINEEINNKLLEEYSQQRRELLRMVNELEQLKVGIEKIFPERLDARYTRFFEEKIKAVTELFKAILDIRKEISKNVKDEIEIRRKFPVDDNKNEMLDIRTLAKRIEQLNKNEMEEGNNVCQTNLN